MSNTLATLNPAPLQHTSLGLVQQQQSTKYDSTAVEVLKTEQLLQSDAEVIAGGTSAALAARLEKSTYEDLGDGHATSQVVDLITQTKRATEDLYKKAADTTKLAEDTAEAAADAAQKAQKELLQSEVLKAAAKHAGAEMGKLDKGIDDDIRSIQEIDLARLQVEERERERNNELKAIDAAQLTQKLSALDELKRVVSAMETETVNMKNQAEKNEQERLQVAQRHREEAEALIRSRQMHEAELVAAKNDEAQIQADAEAKAKALLEAAKVDQNIANNLRQNEALLRENADETKHQAKVLRGMVHDLSDLKPDVVVTTMNRQTDLAAVSGIANAEPVQVSGHSDVASVNLKPVIKPVVTIVTTTTTEETTVDSNDPAILEQVQSEPQFDPIKIEEVTSPSATRNSSKLTRMPSVKFADEPFSDDEATEYDLSAAQSGEQPVGAHNADLSKTVTGVEDVNGVPTTSVFQLGHPSYFASPASAPVSPDLEASGSASSSVPLGDPAAPLANGELPQSNLTQPPVNPATGAGALPLSQPPAQQIPEPPVQTPTSQQQSSGTTPLATDPIAQPPIQAQNPAPQKSGSSFMRFAGFGLLGLLAFVTIGVVVSGYVNRNNQAQNDRSVAVASSPYV